MKSFSTSIKPVAEFMLFPPAPLSLRDFKILKCFIGQISQIILKKKTTKK